MKKAISFTLAAAMLASLLSACSGTVSSGSSSSSDSAVSSESTSISDNSAGYPVASEPVTFTVFGEQHPMHADWSEMDVFQKYEEMTNIHLEFDLAPSQGFAEKKNLLFASGEYPDIFLRAGLSNTEIVKYGASGVLMSISGMLEENAKSYWSHMQDYPAISTRITAPDGNIYALSDVVTQTAARTEKYWLNKDWLEAVGKDVPTTFDELEDVLKSFKALDYDQNGQADEIPLGAGSLDSIINNMIGSWGEQYQFDTRLTISDDGKVSTWMTSDSLKELLQWLNKMYTDGLLDPEIFTQDQAKWNAKMSGQKLGLFFNQADDMFDPASFEGIAPMQGKSDKIYVKSSPVARSNGVFAISTSCEHPELALQWVDYFYSEEGSIFFRFGVEGKTWNRNADGEPEYVDGILNNPDGSGAAIAKFTIWPGGGTPQWINAENSIAVASTTTVAAQEALDPYIPENIYSAPMFTQETNERLAILANDLDKYYTETTAKFVKGEISFDQWDNYIQTLKKIGVDEWVQIYQDALDATAK